MDNKDILEKTNLILGTGEIAIVTGWTPKEKVQAKLKPEDYRVIGQMYSPSLGLTYLLANLLGQFSDVRYLIYLNATKQDVNAHIPDTLRSFFIDSDYYLCDRNKSNWRVGDYSNLSATVFDERMLNRVFFKTTFIEVNSIDELVIKVDQLNRILELKIKKEFASVLVNIPDPETKNIKPNQPIGHRIVAKRIPDAWKEFIRRIRSHGVLMPSGYGKQIQELTSLTIVVTDEIYEPLKLEKLPAYCPISAEQVRSYCKDIMLDDTHAPQGVKYTYGNRIFTRFDHNQFEQVVTKLINEKDALSAVISLWDTYDHVNGGSPCLNHMWFRINEQEQLVMSALFRSNDMFSAWISNAYGLRALQYEVYKRLEKVYPNLTMGALITTSLSAHIYSDCFTWADGLIAENKPKKTYDDPIGVFLVNRYESKVVIQHLEPIWLGGNKIKQYEVNEHNINKVYDVLREIVNDNPTIEPYHAMYLGYEINKALNDFNYKQDR